MTITEFLEARIAEDEQAARAWAAKLGDDLSIPADLLGGIFDPARGLAEASAKRDILARHRPDQSLENWYWLQRKCAECGKGWHKWLPNKLPADIGPEVGCATLRAIASIYQEHLDYKEEWSPRG